VGLFNDLTPFIPLSLKGEGEEILERGFAPLRHPLLLLYRKGKPEGADAPSENTIPLPLIRKASQGDRLLNNL
jgi:hypothetical protein